MAILPTGEDIRISVAQNGYVIVRGQFSTHEADRFRVAETDKRLLEVIAELINAPNAPGYRVWLSRNEMPKAESSSLESPTDFARAFYAEYGGDPGVLFDWFRRAMTYAQQQEQLRDAVKVRAEYFAFRTALAIEAHEIVRKLITDMWAAAVSNQDGSLTLIPAKAAELYRLMMAKSVYDLEPTDQLAAHAAADRLIAIVNEAAASPVDVAAVTNKGASDGR